MNSLNIGSLIRKRRKELNITQEELAELSNLSVNYISKIERIDDQNISLKSLIAIANALNLTLDQLLKDESHNKSTVIGLNNSQQKLLINDLNQFNHKDQFEIIKAIRELLKLMNK